MNNDKNIKFEWNGSFAGHHFWVIVNGKNHSVNDNNPHKSAVKLLKEEYNISMKEEDIDFKWGGKL